MRIFPGFCYRAFVRACVLFVVVVGLQELPQLLPLTRWPTYTLVIRLEPVSVGRLVRHNRQSEAMRAGLEEIIFISLRSQGGREREEAQ